MIKKMEEQEARQAGRFVEENRVQKKIEKHEKRWKQKFIRIWQFNEDLKELEQSRQMMEYENSVGPSNFMPIMKLG